MSCDGSELLAILKRRREKTDSDILREKYYGPSSFRKRELVIGKLVRPADPQESTVGRQRGWGAPARPAGSWVARGGHRTAQSGLRESAHPGPQAAARRAAATEAPPTSASEDSRPGSAQLTDLRPKHGAESRARPEDPGPRVREPPVLGELPRAGPRVCETETITCHSNADLQSHEACAEPLSILEYSNSEEIPAGRHSPISSKASETTELSPCIPKPVDISTITENGSSLHKILTYSGEAAGEPVPAPASPPSHFQSFLYKQLEPDAGPGEDEFGYEEFNRETGIPEKEAVNQAMDLGDDCPKHRKIDEVLRELSQTEAFYVEKLRHLARDYAPALARADAPPALRYYRDDIFCNVRQLHRFHARRFRPALEAAGTDLARVAAAFLDHEKEFSMYILYSTQNKKAAKFASEYIDFFKIIQTECNQRLDICSYLMEPVQRMPRYEMLLKSLLKRHEQAEGPAGQAVASRLAAAVELVNGVLRQSNDAIAVANITNSQINLHEQGKLIRQQEFTVTDPLKKKVLMRCFLFEKSLVFTVPCALEDFRYELSMDTSELGLTLAGAGEGQLSVWFLRRDYLPHRLQAAPEDCQAWAADISELLWQQARLKREKLQKPGSRATPLVAATGHGEPEDVVLRRPGGLPDLRPTSTELRALRPASADSPGPRPASVDSTSTRPTSDEFSS